MSEEVRPVFDVDIPDFNPEWELHDCEYLWNRLKFWDLKGSTSVPEIIDELERGYYNICSIEYKPGDIAVDIGAHVGVVCLFLAKTYPQLTIHAFEPNPVTFACLTANAKLNGVEDRVVCYNTGVTKDGRPLYLRMPLDNTGGATEFRNPPTGFKIISGTSITMAGMFKTIGIDDGKKMIKLLKIDCEGAEHELLTNNELLKRVDRLSAEFHINNRLAKKGHKVQNLYVSCGAFIDESRMWVVCEQIPE